MAWRRIVIRPDSIIRWWSLAQLDCPGGFARVFNSPYFQDINFNSLVAISDGSEHIRMDEFGSLNMAMIKASRDNPSLFQDIGKHYEGVIEEWLSYCSTLPDLNLTGMSNPELGALLTTFTDLYKEFSPILFVPFVVEKRYETEYPALVQRLAEKVRSNPEEVRTVLPAEYALELIGAADADLRDTLRSMLEYSPRRTVAEQKEDALQVLAAEAEADPDTAPLFKDTKPPKWKSVTDVSARLAFAFRTTLAEFKWIGHWGYPPRFADSTMEDFLRDVHERIQQGAAETLKQSKARDQRSEGQYFALTRWLDDSDRQLIEDLNYYNYLRTARMEAKIRAQYLSIPLFTELQRRGEAAGVLAPFDIYLMVPPEIHVLLECGQTPANLAERRSGWVLVTHAARGEWRVLAGEEKEDFENQFYSVISWRENARGLHTPTSAFVGGKGDGLFKLTQAGCEVPPFFVVTAEAFRRVIAHNHVGGDIESILANLRTDEERKAAAVRCRALVEGSTIPASVEQAISEAFAELSAERVAVRSSATVEDAADASWAGRFETVLDVTDGGLQAAILKVWGSLFTERSLAYAVHAQVNLASIPMAVVVQAMIQSESSGVMNTVFSGDNENLVEIEAAYGYGAAVVDGEITPDRYLVDVSSRAVVDKQIAKQTRMLTATGWEEVTADHAESQKLNDRDVLALAELGKRLERELGGPQDVEFAVADGHVAIVQARPLTGIDGAPLTATGADIPAGARLIASGLKGKTATVLRKKCQVLTDLAQSDEFEDGNILVVTAATPAWDGVVFRASALITNDGGSTSHAIRVANERRIPVVVGTNSATEVIPDGAELVMDTAQDPFKGRIYLVP